jgi:anti-sigma factor RsiW
MARCTGLPIIVSACRVAALGLTLAGCSGIPGFGRSEEPPVDPKAYPANYKTDLVGYLQTHASLIEGVRNAALSAPALAQLAGTESRYTVCLRTEGADGRKDKMIVYYGGVIIQYVDATGAPCATAAYQPFPELLAVVAQMQKQK